MPITRLFFRITVLLTMLAACATVSSNQTQSDYDKLCTIYQEVMSKPISPLMAGVEISERVKKEIPDVYVNFENISTADPDKAYQLYKSIAEKETKKPWDCKIMKDFYSGKLRGKK